MRSSRRWNARNVHPDFCRSGARWGRLAAAAGALIFAPRLAAAEITSDYGPRPLVALCVALTFTLVMSSNL